MPVQKATQVRIVFATMGIARSIVSYGEGLNTSYSDVNFVSG